MSSRLIVYKGLLLAPQIPDFYKDLRDPETRSSLSMVHQRFSTNTFPSWKLAHPYRYVCHNGEINTVRGNVNWMSARESTLQSDVFGNDITKVLPVIRPDLSDTGSLDNAVEFLTLGGRSLPHVMAMLIPEAWDADTTMPQEKRDFYEYHASLMEPWDGPAAVAFTDGKWIGATLDRNGLRPARYLVTKDGQLIIASETGVLPVKPENVSYKGRLQPGKMLLVNLEEHRIVPDEEIKHKLATRQPYGDWLKQNQITIESLPEPSRVHGFEPKTIQQRQRAFGYTEEDLRILMAPMAEKGEEPIGSMGTDTPLACLSDRPQPLFNYFKQLFAQVTNPAIDPIREELVMSLTSYIGTERNILEETALHCHTLKLSHPILTNFDLERLRRVSWGTSWPPPWARCTTLSGGAQALEDSLGRAVHAGQPFDSRRLPAADSFRPRRRQRQGSYSEPAGADCGPQSPGARAEAHASGANHRIGRAPRGDALCSAHGLWRERDQSLLGDRNTGGHVAKKPTGGGLRDSAQKLQEGHQQGAAQGHL